MAFELIWSSDDVDNDTVSLNGISAVETIHDISNKTFNNYSRLIMQFSKSTDTAPNHLYIDIVIKMKSGKSYPPKLQTYLVCYGVKGLQSDVSSQVYDALWGVDDGKVIMNEVIDMGNKAIIGIKADTVDTGAVNYEQLISHVFSIEQPLKRLIDQKVNEKQNKSYYEELFDYWFDCLDPNMFNVNRTAYGSVIEKINDKLVLGADIGFSEFNISNGFQLFGSHIQLDKIYDLNDDFTMFITFKHDTAITDSKQYLHLVTT